MKVGIIAANNIRYSPYIGFHTRILNEIGINFELIFPDRMSIVDDFEAPMHVLPWNRKMPTAVEYYRYTKSAKRVVEKEKYDLLIVLTTNIAVYMARWLKKTYSKKYILDIRDYTHENIPVFFSLEKQAVEHSLLNVISSKKFKSFLPEGEYLTCHNMRETDTIFPPEPKKDPPITIAYLGTGGYMDNCIRICEKVSGDKRFRFDLYGIRTIPESLAPYQAYENISVNGMFAPDEKESIIQKSDILFNVYGNGTPLLDYALSNKLYDALIYGKPILTSPRTYMSESAGPFAFDVDFSSSSFLDDLFAWYTALDKDALAAYAQSKLAEFTQEGQQTIDAVKSAIRSLL